MHNPIQYNNKQAQLVNLFRHKAVYTRDEMRTAAIEIYKSELTLWKSLQNLEHAKMIEIRRRGHSTIIKKGIAAEYKLTINGLDWLATKTGADDIPVPVVQKKPRKIRAMVTNQPDPNPCNVVMRVCYASGCYLKTKCDAFKGEKWNTY